MVALLSQSGKAYLTPLLFLYQLTFGLIEVIIVDSITQWPSTKQILTSSNQFSVLGK